MNDKIMFGVSTSSYQIEGAVHEDGRTDCIWDTYSKEFGNILNGDTGEDACDHYHRYREDIGLIRELGADIYRFSISWNRIYPEKDRYNPSGMAFYRNLLKELKEKEIKACVTIYHWDLPQWAQNLGGWENRECVAWYLQFAEKLFEELDDDVSMWITHNEPYCSGFLGYYKGEHAPGRKTPDGGLKAVHHLLLSHGKAVEMYRKKGGKHPIGITLNLGYMYPSSDSVSDHLACRMADGYTNRWFLDALFRGKYPNDMLTYFAARYGIDYSFIQQGDMECISVRTDFLGINHYSSTTVRYAPYASELFESCVTQKAKTSMGWDIDPEAFENLIVRVRKEYTEIPVYITENGSAWQDVLDQGCVHDADRTLYMEKYIDIVDRLNEKGMNIKGYFCWSLLDNFEWPSGYSQRFGIVYVDYLSQKRIKKDSYFTYQHIIEKHRKQPH